MAGIVWTRERCVEAIRRWAHEHGRPPTQEDWRRGQHLGDYPACGTVLLRFGTWAAAFEAAGFEPRRAGGGRQLRVSRIAKTCPVCGGEFSVLPSDAHRTYCSRSCVGRAKRRYDIQELIDLRRSGLLNTEIAERLGVSRHSVANHLSRARREGWEIPQSRWRRYPTFDVNDAIALRKEGLLNTEIAKRLQVSTQRLSQAFRQARGKGLNVPPSPYGRERRIGCPST